MAVANGLIPSLGAMIYGKLTDELVIRENWNCTLNDSVSTLLLKNMVILEMIQPRLKAINATKTKSIEVTVNKTGIRVIIIGLNGKLLNETYFKERNTTSVILKGTALNATKLMGIDVTGTRVETVKLKEKDFLNGKTFDETKDGKIGKRKGNEVIRHANRDNHGPTSNTLQNDKESQASFIYIKRHADIFSNHLKDASLYEEFMKKGFVEKSRKRRQTLSFSGKKALFSDKIAKTAVNSALDSEKRIKDKHAESGKKYKLTSRGAQFTDQGKPNEKISFHNTRIENSELNTNEKESDVQPSNAVNRENHETFSDDGVKVQSIRILPVTPTPKILPETNNINYTLRNITETCRLVQNRVEDNMSKYALYYVYAAVGTLVFAYGQMVLWNIASERGVRNLSENLTDSMMDKDPGFYDTKIHEGVVNLEGVT